MNRLSEIKPFLRSNLFGISSNNLFTHVAQHGFLRFLKDLLKNLHNQKIFYFRIGS